MSAPQMRVASDATGSVDQPSGAWPLLNAAMFASTVSIAVETFSWSTPVRFVTSMRRSDSTTPPPSLANLPLFNTLSADAQNAAIGELSGEDDAHAAPDPAKTATAIKDFNIPAARLTRLGFHG